MGLSYGGAVLDLKTLLSYSPASGNRFGVRRMNGLNDTFFGFHYSATLSEVTIII